ncbi:glycerophosphodiester phosphodiesterase family protein [Methyloceanibacter sp. wino2]|uniref:glycerophosphodiester phosphodiesterase family protein n=1 Tax=Methyloceanibacter sp. wino2 TaxID=2170729 RepID=UPI000D3ED1EB|nr:glycerophosphodiester phosphodiesterase family protein [Methyloceanibacter sp. wino2]
MGELYWLKRPIAHRGLHDAARGIVENSASAVKAAMRRGIAVEVDLQRAAGDMPVVFHDVMLDRLTNESGPVAARDVEALRAIPLKDGGGDRILSLPELLELVGDTVPLVLEVKNHGKGDGAFEANIAKLLAGYHGPVAVMSFDPHAVAAFRQHAPTLPRGLVSCRFNDEFSKTHLSTLQRFAMRHLLTSTFARPHFVAYDVNALPAVAPLLAKFAAGLPLLAWTVRTEADLARALRYADAPIFEEIAP